MVCVPDGLNGSPCLHPMRAGDFWFICVGVGGKKKIKNHNINVKLKLPFTVMSQNRKYLSGLRTFTQAWKLQNMNSG